MFLYVMLRIEVCSSACEFEIKHPIDVPICLFGQVTAFPY